MCRAEQARAERKEALEDRGMIKEVPAKTNTGGLTCRMCSARCRVEDAA